ncbi:hypothetical protein SDC9_205958 [bioreactor metagenome]|uniref:Uncharacterized protein n=1 Tax=bioreactor metagenome TaxID=1076179 RepID=A0A645J3G0_9ZZZZ|nr:MULTISPECIES: hypothetical protein [Comamonas]UUC93162.1 hypothetical protein NOX35_23365 [Comamonas sp. C11]WEE77156.1 hypothetical protein LZ683_23965 [Comamonas testosteroni]
MTVLDAHPALWRDVCMLVLERLHEQIATQQRRALGHTANMWPMRWRGWR